MKKSLQKGIIGFQTVLLIASPIFLISGSFFGGKIVVERMITGSNKELTAMIVENDKEIALNKNDMKNMDEKLDDMNNKLDILIGKF